MIIYMHAKAGGIVFYHLLLLTIIYYFLESLSWAS